MCEFTVWVTFFSFFLFPFYFEEHSLGKTLMEISLSKAPAITLALVEYTLTDEGRSTRA